MKSRFIIHVDMDAFFASVEVLDNPTLAGKPLIVGGGTNRGVVSAASYEARKFGVHSAMPMSQALRRCPQAIVLPVHMGHYHEISQRIMALLATYTPLLEQVSVDEAYLDITQWLPAGVTHVEVARDIQQRIAREIGLSCSVGIASGKAIAKMASDLRKPNGFVIVPEGEEAQFLSTLPIGTLRGVGEATERKLRALSIKTIGDLARSPVSLIVRKFGVQGRELHNLANGRDDSPVVPERQAKSIGREVTFPVDVTDHALLEKTLLELADDVAESLRKHQMLARGITIKLRYDDFTTITRSHTLADLAAVTGTLYQQGLAIFREVKTVRPVRLIGLTAGPLAPQTQRQLSLFDNSSTEKEEKLDAVIDVVRARFGGNAITRARLAGKPPEKNETAD
ncbi:MAG TPA: DNA polymerase IV [Armatimonadota bacterium]|nr:DNA polymerase IV [Armatimonadota bacterium]